MSNVNPFAFFRDPKDFIVPKKELSRWQMSQAIYTALEGGNTEEEVRAAFEHVIESLASSEGGTR